MSAHEPPSDPRAAEASLRAGYELRDARVGPLALATVGLFGLVCAAMFGMRSLFRALDARAPDADVHSMASERQIPPEPRLQVRPSADSEAFWAEHDRALSTYDWIDRDAGIVRIPIERAMELTVERGLPHRAAEGDGK